MFIVLLSTLIGANIDVRVAGQEEIVVTAGVEVLRLVIKVLNDGVRVVMEERWEGLPTMMVETVVEKRLRSGRRKTGLGQETVLSLRRRGREG